VKVAGNGAGRRFGNVYGVNTMKAELLKEVIACLPKERTVFHYTRDDYALMLLARYVGNGKTMREVRQTKFGGLLNKATIRRILADEGSGMLSSTVFDYAYVEGRKPFLLTTGSWNEEKSSYNQTSRNEGNLVLRMNFSAEHDREFQRVVHEEEVDYFQYCGHPVLREGERRYFRYTLAWVRMDVDFDENEVLIEEVQNDWLRHARWYQKRLEWCLKYRKNIYESMTVNGKVKAAIYYAKEILAPYYRIWDEAALTAAIQFATDELGIRNIYYHTFETGNALKGIDHRHPPRSLYTNLPRRFCFEQTHEVPVMLQKSRAVKRKLKKFRNPSWHRLAT